MRQISDDDVKEIIEQGREPLRVALQEMSEAGRALIVATQAMAEALRAQSGPKRIVRDEAGRVIGVEPEV